MNDLQDEANQRLTLPSPTDELGTSGTASGGSAELTPSQSSEARVVVPSVSQFVGDAPSVAQQLDSDSDSPDEPYRRVNPGHFQPGNTAALKHGGRRSLDRPEALIAIAGKRAELPTHLGDESSVIQHDLVTDYARTDVLIESVAANIEVGGIFTAKGRTRAAVTLLLSLMDRRLRLATTLGIERKQRQVNPLDAVRAAVEEANRQPNNQQEPRNGSDATTR